MLNCREKRIEMKTGSDRLHSAIVLTSVIVAYLGITGCVPTAEEYLSTVTEDPATETDPGTEDPGTEDPGTGTDPAASTVSLAGNVDSSLTADSFCSAAESAYSVYIYRGNTVIAVDRSGSSTDPISIVPVTRDDAGSYVYGVDLDPGIYTVAFTCQADLDQPTVAGDPVAFRAVTNVVIAADEQTTHDFTVGASDGGGLNPNIRTMPANSWYEVPNSQMQAVKADFPAAGVSLPGSIRGLLNYSGGAFDTKRNRMILWGGGHNDYYGNEIYAFDLTNFAWERVTEPSPPTTRDACVAVLADGNPNSRHTYYNLEYVPTIDKFWSSPAGSVSCGSGSGTDDITWSFNFETKQWSDMAATGTAVIGWAPSESAYDSLTDKVYSVSRGGLYEYDVNTNHWQRLNSVDIAGDRGVVVDTKRHLLVVVGNAEVVVYDIGNQDYTPQRWNTTGGEFNVKYYRPGVNYDPVADRVVVWHDGAVHALDMDTREWTQLAVAPQSANTRGTYGRFRYSPIENAYVLVNDAAKNVLIYKLTEGGGKQ